MNQKAALSDAQPQPFASSRPKNARPRVCLVPGCRACCAIVLHPTGRSRPALKPRWCVPYLTSRVPVIVDGWTWQRYVYVPALRAGTEYERFSGPWNGLVSPPTATGALFASSSTTLCGTVGSWSSKTRVKAVSALAVSVFSLKPAVAAPLSAVTVTVGALGLIEAAGAPDAPAPP